MPQLTRERPDLTAAAEAACRCLLSLWNGSLPVEPAVLLRALPGVELLEWQQASFLLRESGHDPMALPAAFGGRVSAIKLEGERYGRPVTDIVLLPGLMPTERHFALAHELGHILLKHECESQAADREANCFASQLLLPRAAALLLLPKGRLLPGDLPRLARRFLVEPGLIRQAEREGWQYPRAFSDELTRLFARSCAEGPT